MGPRSRHALELIFALVVAPLFLAADNPLGGTAKPAPLSEVVQADTVPLPPPMDETPPAETDNRKKQQADAPAILILSNAYLQTANWLRRPSVPPATRPSDGVIPASAQDVEQLPTPQWRTAPTCHPIRNGCYWSPESVPGTGIRFLRGLAAWEMDCSMGPASR